MKKLLSCCIVIVLAAQMVWAEPAVYIEQIISKKFPEMEVYVGVKDTHEPIMSLVPGNFKAMVDGKEVSKKLDIQGFQYAEQGIAYAVLLSASGVMSGEIMSEQQKAVVNLMEKLGPKDTLSVYYFSGEVKTLFEYQPKDENLIKELAKIEPLGGNPKLFDALVFATRRLADAKEKRKVLMVMSDGRNMESNYTKEQFLKIIDEQNIPLYGCGIYMMGGRNLSNIHELTMHTGGGYMHARYPSLISDRLIHLNKQITHGYIVKFKATGVKGDDDYHQLTITVNSEGKEVSASKNFLAVKTPVPLWVKILIIVFNALVAIAIIILLLLLRRASRRKLGITKRKCPVCKRRMKDDWDECVFCKYLPPKKKKKKKKKTDDE